MQHDRPRTREPQELDHTSISTIHSVRPDSRGGRLGRAMAEGLTASPATSPRPASFHSHTRTLSGQQQAKKSTGSRKTSSESFSRKMANSIFPTPQVDGVDRIRVGIMCQMDNVADLQACSQVSKDFRLTFQKYETLLVDRVLFQQSPAAWELRHSVRHLEKPSPFRLRSVQRDMSTVAALVDFIVWRCQSILRPETVNALLGEAPRRKAELEEALWIIWTFCNLFGKTSMSDATLLKQTQWLNGGVTRASSSSSRDLTRTSPASLKELEDMSEMWRCLEMLLSGFKGQEEEARRIGLFDNVGESKASDTDLLIAWINDVLSLGPKAVLTLSSCDFAQAKVLGVTRWTPPAKGKSRSNFLKAAVEEVYRERLMQEARRKASDFRKNMKEAHKRSRSDPAVVEPGMSSHRQSSQAESRHLKLDTRQAVRQSMPPQGLPSHQQERIEIRPDCDPLSTGSAYSAPILSPSTNPMVFSPLAMTKNASVKLGANLFPMQNRDQSKRYSIPLTSMNTDQDILPDPDVIDPVDRAVNLLVNKMGFSEANAKRALAMSDTGSGINIQEAVELLSVDAQLPVVSKQKQICELPAAVDGAKLAPKPVKREYCEGSCKPLMLVEPKKDRVTGLGLVKRGMSYRMSFKKSNRLSVIVDDEEVGMGIGIPGSSSRPHSGSTKLAAITELASSTSDAIAPSPISKSAPLSAVEEYTCAGALPSPISPVTPPTQDWLKPDTNPLSDAEAYLNKLPLKPRRITPPAHDWLKPDTNPLSEADAYLNKLPLKPRVTLTRVGTGINKTRWSLPGKKRKEHVIQPEVIGYAY